MILDNLNYSFNAKRYGLTADDLEGLELEGQANLVIRKMQNYIDQETTAKAEYDKKAAEAAAAFKEYQRLRGKAKGRADQARSQLITFRKNLKENIDLINYKKAKNAE